MKHIYSDCAMPWLLPGVIRLDDEANAEISALILRRPPMREMIDTTYDVYHRFLLRLEPSQC